MNHLFKILTLSLFATVCMAASDVEQDVENQPFHMRVTTQNDGDIEFYGDETKFLITCNLTRKVLFQSTGLQGVTQIDLSGMELIGNFPKEIGLLPNLKKLDLSNNSLTGVDFSGFEKGDDYRRIIEVRVYGNPLGTFIGPMDEAIFIQLAAHRNVSVHIDAGACQRGDFSPLKDLFKKNVQSNITEEAATLNNIRISFYNDIPIPHILTEKFGITHEGHDLFKISSTTVITRQWVGNQCNLDVKYLVKRRSKKPLLNALDSVLDTVLRR